MSQAWFSPELFVFLRALAENNDRDWFTVDKARYEAVVKDPFLRFISALEPHLDAVSPHLDVNPKPVGGSFFRIHRDTRFSKDKTPYKTNAAAHFPMRGERGVGSVPGFYLSLGTERSMAGAGVWRPEPAALGKVRDAIVSRPDDWAAVLAMGLEIGGDALARPPKGYDPAHRFIEDLKRKDFVASVPVSEADACAPDFLDRYVAICERGAPLANFLAEAMELDG